MGWEFCSSEKRGFEMALLDSDFELGDYSQVEVLEGFLKEHAQFAVRAATKAYQEVLRLRQVCDRLERQVVLAEIRSCEAQVNALREHQNAWAILLLCVQSGVTVTAFEALTVKTCRQKIVELQTRSCAALARASVAAAQVGCIAQTGIEDGKVFVRLAVSEVTGEGDQPSGANN